MSAEDPKSKGRRQGEKKSQQMRAQGQNRSFCRKRERGGSPKKKKGKPSYRARLDLGEKKKKICNQRRRMRNGEVTKKKG